ncbi:MAG TPA: hypothetical protein VE687_11805, partial [Stellaceae bacterium]|nr:hypothetical protein [Stellaceae bacterium]
MSRFDSRSRSQSSVPMGSDIVWRGRHEVSRTGRSGLEQVTANQMGRSYPLGATVLAGGVNFSVFSRRATQIELLLFDDVAAAHPARVIDLDARTH